MLHVRRDRLVVTIELILRAAAAGRTHGAAAGRATRSLHCEDGFRRARERTTARPTRSLHCEDVFRTAGRSRSARSAGLSLRGRARSALDAPTDRDRFAGA